VIQWIALIANNAYLKGFAEGRVYRGSLKSICVPGLNCYSCPGAAASCPLGALQAVLGDYRYKFSFYVVGLMMGFGLVFGRLICGFLCPFGLMQELFYKIPSRKAAGSGARWLRWGKYVTLAVFVIAIPVFFRGDLGIGEPAFCKYICPAGTITAGLPLVAAQPSLREAAGGLFAFKVFAAAAIAAACVVIYRFFCKFLCPLGAFYGFFNRIALYRMSCDGNSCVRCGACSRVCRMGVDPSREPDSAECIRCGDCLKACPSSALGAGFEFVRKGGAKDAGECARG
jgi:polyferredoxin